LNNVKAGADNLVPWRHLWAEENRSGWRELLLSLRFFRLTFVTGETIASLKRSRSPSYSRT